MEERDFLLKLNQKIDRYYEAQKNLDEYRKEKSAMKEDFLRKNEEKRAEISKRKRKINSRIRRLDKDKEELDETIKRHSKNSKDSATYKAATKEQAEKIEQIKSLIKEKDDMEVELEGLKQQKKGLLEIYNEKDEPEMLKKLEEYKKEIVGVKEDFLRENEEKQTELKKQKRRIDSKRRRLEKIKKGVIETLAIAPKSSDTYKTATKEQAEKVKEIKSLCKESDDIAKELEDLKQQKKDFLMKYEKMDFTTEEGISKLDKIIKNDPVVKETIIQKEQDIAEAEAIMSQQEKADEQEARKLEEEIMKKRLEEKNGNDVPPQNPTQKGKNVTDVPPQNPMQNKIEIVIGRQATVKVGENSENVDKKYIKEARNIIFLRQFLKDNNINLENINMPELDKNFSKNKMIDPVVMTAIIKSKSLDEKQRQEILEGYLKGNLESSEIKIVYDLGDLSKTSILNRIFSRTEVNLSEKEKMLRYAEVANENGIAEVRGQYRPNKFISMMSGMVKGIRNIKELLPFPKSKTYGLSDGKEAGDYTLSKEERKMFESMMSNDGKYKGIKIESKTNTTVRDEIDNPDKTYHSIEEAKNDEPR